MPRPVIAFCALFGALLIAGGVMWALCCLQSDPGERTAEFLIGVAGILVTGLFGFSISFHTCRRWPVFIKAIGLHFACLALGYAAFEATWHWLVPSNINFEFSYPGASGSYHAVRFHFKVNGQWIAGPSVEGWPVTVRFPDLNGDGHPDIRVTETNGSGVVEFVYLPDDNGKVYWHLVKNSSALSAAYEPAREFSNYP